MDDSHASKEQGQVEESKGRMMIPLDGVYDGSCASPKRLYENKVSIHIAMRRKKLSFERLLKTKSSVNDTMSTMG
jgi:hypothetical protein